MHTQPMQRGSGAARLTLTGALGALSACAVLFFSGCTTQTPLNMASTLPANWQQQVGATAHTTPDPTPNTTQWPDSAWYARFGSDELNALITQANNNFDMAAAQARIEQANARAKAAGAALLPEIDANGNVAYGAGHSREGSAHETDWSALVSASYEVDFWGKQRAARRSATWLAAAVQAERDTLRLTTFTSIANTYFQLLSLRERLSIANQNLDAARNVLSAVQARFDAGVVAPVELATQKAAVATAELVIAPLAQQEVEARAALALLTGNTPERFAVNTQSLASMNEPSIAPGLPAELLQRRPDIFAAEANLLAAHADVQNARAALFPSLTLTGSTGVQNPALQAAVITLQGTGYGISLGANLVQSIFDGGRRRATRDEVAAREQELLSDYRRAILNALIDVETALSALQHLNSQRSAQQEQLAQSERAFEGAQMRYQVGSGDYLTLLEAQRALYSAREQFSEYKLARLQAIVGLSKALGGGWQSPDNNLHKATS